MLYTRDKAPCTKYESCQEPEQQTSVCYFCGWLRKDHNKELTK